MDKETVRRLPGSLEEAVAALESNSVLRESLGAPLMVAVVAVRKVLLQVKYFLTCTSNISVICGPIFDMLSMVDMQCNCETLRTRGDGQLKC